LTVTLGLADATTTEVIGQAPEPGTLLAVNAVSHGSLFSGAVPSPARR
jgi:hypothetical protein